MKSVWAFNLFSTCIPSGKITHISCVFHVAVSAGNWPIEMLKIFAEHREHIAKIHRQYSWDVCGCCSDEEEGLILLN